MSDLLTESGDLESELMVLTGEVGGLILLAAKILAHGLVGLVGELGFSGNAYGGPTWFLGVGVLLSSISGSDGGGAVEVA